MTDDADDDPDDQLRYRDPGEIGQHEFGDALNSLCLFGDDPYLRMQAFNLSVIDEFIMDLERQTLCKYMEEEPSRIVQFESCRARRRDHRQAADFRGKTGHGDFHRSATHPRCRRWILKPRSELREPYGTVLAVPRRRVLEVLIELRREF